MRHAGSPSTNKYAPRIGNNRAKHAGPDYRALRKHLARIAAASRRRNRG